MNESSWVLVAQVPLSQNLGQLSKELSRRDINHKIVADEQRQSLWLENAEYIQVVDDILAKQVKPEPNNPWFDPSAKVRPRPQNASTNHTRGGLSRLFAQYPVVLSGIALSLLGAVLPFMIPKLGNLLLFPPLYDMKSGQFWRLVTPIFLHFGAMHVVFNCLWLWVFGSRLEPYVGRLNFVTLILLTGIAGNVTQYFWSNSVLFGGMSGVNYGLMGYIWIRHKLRPHPMLELPPALFGFMFVFLILGMTGGMDWLAGGGIANGAHLGGLLAGLVMGLLSSAQRRNN